MITLKRLVWVALFSVAFVLASIIFLGGYQYRLANRYATAIDQNERLLFHFLTIRESITFALLDDNPNNIKTILPGIETMNGYLTQIQKNKLVSSDIKLGLVDKIDLTGLMIDIKTTLGHKDQEKKKALQEKLRSISAYLIQFDRILVGQARERLINFQKVIIGVLGLIITLVSFSLILFYKNTVAPLIQLSNQLQSKDIFANGLRIAPPVVEELALLIQRIEPLISSYREQQEDSTSCDVVDERFANVINESSNKINGIINYTQLLSDSFGSSALSTEQQEIFKKIIDNSESIAIKWQNLQ